MSSQPRLADRILAGDPRAIARAISLVENDDPASVELIRTIYPHTGRAYLVGVTGPPGAGKSTLVDKLVKEIRGRSVLDTPEHHGARASGVGVGPHATDKSAPRGVSKVGVLAVDPTSPFTGGAVLGDRLRMQGHASDEGVFIRSMATRGYLGGLARSTADAALVLDAAGYDVILIETVGVGQDEVEIVRTADISLVTLVPGTGDDVQALKAGIMEIADVFVVNKADREGAERLASAIEAAEGLKSFGADEWRPPIVKTVATTAQGIPELLACIAAFRARGDVERTARRRQASESRLRDLVASRFMHRLEQDVLGAGELQALAARVSAREIDPYTAADGLVEQTLRGSRGSKGSKGSKGSRGSENLQNP